MKSSNVAVKLGEDDMLNMTIVNFFRMNQRPMTATMTTKTVVKLNKNSADKKSKNTFGTVYKIQKMIVLVNGNYEKRVNQQRAIEGAVQDFQVAELPWGKRVDGTKCIIEHNGGGYLQTILQGYTSRKVEYVDSEGKEVKFEDIQPFMPAKKEVNKGTRQEVEEEVRVRTVGFNSIQELIIQTEELVVRLV